MADELSNAVNSEPNKQELTTAAAEQLSPNTPPDTVRAFDANGNEVQIPRADWAAQILPNLVKEQWDNPEGLYAIILNSLNEGFLAEMVEPAERLYQTDTLPGRGVSMWAVVLMQSDRLDEAEEVMTKFLAEHGDDGSVLVNLAQLQVMKGRKEESEATLLHALEVEPNLDNGLGWYVALEGERGGAARARAALERIAAMPTSWRAQLWIAREELQAGSQAGNLAGNLEKAKALYSEALTRAPRPVPPDFMMQMSGDLGTGGHLIELINLTAPEYRPEVHGMPVGNNLLKAFVDTDNLDSADSLRRALLSMGRPDWRQALEFWDMEIGKKRASQPQQQPGQLQIGMLRVDGPVWLPPQSPARVIFGGKAEGPSVSFLGGSAEGPQPETENPEAATRLDDSIARMTRSLPLFLAEQVEMRTAAQGRAVIPWAVPPAPGQPGGFVVSGNRWPDEVSVQMVSDPANKSDYVVSVHLDAEVIPWTVELAFVRTDSGTRIGELEAEFDPEDPSEGLSSLAHEMVELLSVLGPAEAASHYTVPQGKLLVPYLAYLEQLLYLRCAGMEGAVQQAPEAQQALLEGEFNLAKSAAASIPARLLLVETLGAFTRINPEVANGFQQQFERLMLEYPLAPIDTVFNQ